jgi:16S rRNA (uracil1498-N3)-methyltransferase
MRLTRLYLPLDLSPGALVVLPESQAGHLTRVLRLEAGAPLTIFNGRGGEHAAVIEQVRRHEVAVRVGVHRAVECESPLRITLLQGIARGEKMDLILQKATELGVERIVPLAMTRTNVRLHAESAARKQEHWQAVVAGACEQSGRNRVPVVAMPATLAEALRQEQSDLRLLLSPQPDALSLIALLASAPATIALLVGPEGGFDPEEIQAARSAAFQSCRLGPRVLRTETAALAALAALQLAAGDFR